VRSKPSDAVIYVSEEKVGRTPARLDLPCDTPTIRLEHPRYEPAEHAIELNPNRMRKLEIDLDRPHHDLRIRSVPPGAEVWVGGVRVGVTPLKTQILGFERTPIKLKKFGYRTLTRTIYSKRSEVLKFKFAPFWMFWSD
jgi:hypothetical protein